MTAPERLEPRLPALFTELAAARVPDYFDDMLQRTAAAKQRPAWRSPERWLPMEVATRPLGGRMPTWQPLALLALLVLAVAAAMLLAGGLRSAPLPEPFGPAANGPIYFSTPEGDILAVDAPTGAARTIVDGASYDEGPWFSPRGDRFLFARITDGIAALMIANADGGGVRDITPSTGLGDWVEWSPEGDRVVVTTARVTPTKAAVVAIRDGREQFLDFDFRVDWIGWRPGHDQLVVAGGKERENFILLADPNGPNRLRLGIASGLFGNPSLSPDGMRIAYTTWGLEPEAHGRIYVHDIETGRNTALNPNLDDGFTYRAPQFSPDGETLLVERYGSDDTFTMAILAADGTGVATPLGPARPAESGGAVAGFSPDGTSILATYRDDQATWLLQVDGSTPLKVGWATPGYWSWQRLAP